MTGFSPFDGVPPGHAQIAGGLAYAPTIPPVTNCPILFHKNGCRAPNDRDAWNYLFANWLRALDEAGIAYDCRSPDQLFAMICSIAQKCTGTTPPPGVGGKVIYDFTGTQQNFIVPPNAASIRIKLWGAGGGQNAMIYGAGNYPGGPGGFTDATFPATGSFAPGQSLIVLVGQGGQVYPGDGSINFGFGGAETASASGGGGLSGVFSPGGMIGAADYARALAVAGAGGASGEDSDYPGVVNWGGSGNDAVLGGGMADMLGKSSTAKQNAGGGGGYRGGAWHQRNPISAGTSIYGGNGGTGYVAPAATSSSIQSSPDHSMTPPQTGDADYAAGIGVGGHGAGGIGTDQSGGHGRVVIEWMV